MNTLTNAKKLLAKRNAECVVLCDEAVHVSYERGVSPIIKWLKKDRDFFSGTSVADKAVGISEAYLLTFGGVRQVYAPIMSVSATEVFDKHGIKYECGERVNHVSGCDGIDVCQVDSIAIDASSPEEAYVKIMAMSENKYNSLN